MYSQSFPRKVLKLKKGWTYGIYNWCIWGGVQKKAEMEVENQGLVITLRAKMGGTNHIFFKDIINYCTDYNNYLNLKLLKF